MKKLFLSFYFIIGLVSCHEETIIEDTELPHDIIEIQKSLVGSWKTYHYTVVRYQDIIEGNEVIIYSYDDSNICNIFAEILPEQDFIDAYDVSIEKDMLEVNKTYRCSNKTERVIWQIEKVTQNNHFVDYLILEKNEFDELINVYKRLHSGVNKPLVLEAIYKSEHPPFTIINYRIELKNKRLPN